jgi:hypothetical protein
MHDQARDIERAVSTFVTRVDIACGALKELHDLLDHERELTPDQARRMADSLAHLGMGASHVLMADLELTAEREGSPVH